VELYFNSPNTPSWHGAQLEEHRDNFTFTFLPFHLITYLTHDENESPVLSNKLLGCFC
jgi:hypothetical protein